MTAVAPQVSRDRIIWNDSVRFEIFLAGGDGVRQFGRRIPAPKRQEGRIHNERKKQ